NYPGIDQVLCSVQGEGSNAVLVAFIVTGSDLKENKINKYLKKYLPEYMLPGIYYNIDKLPVNTGGKLDRKLLPLVVSNDNNNELEDIDFESDDLLTFIKSVVSKHLKKDIRPEDDFFNKGGNSLLAALIISDLRKNPKTSSLAVRDIYKLKTINKLYDKIINSENSNSLQKQKIQKSGLKSYPTLVTIFQGIWILLGIGIVSNFSYLFFYYLLPWLFSKLGIYLFLFSLPVILYSLGYLAFVVNVSLATIFKKLLIGKYKEGRYPIWGSYYLKHWIVQTFLKWLPWNMIEGTGVFNFVLKILGARIGKGVYIHRGIVCFNGALDKLEIGDNVTIGRDVALQTISYESQEMVVGSVKIGSNSNISLRASLFPNSSVGENSEIKELSVIFSDQNIPDNEKWSGIPAKLESKNDKIKRIEDLSEGTFTFYSLISRLFLFYLSYFPFIIFSILAITYFKNEYKNISNLSSFNPLENIYQIILISIMEVVGIIFTFFWNAFLCKNLFKIQYGDHSCFSFSMIKAWSKETWIQTSGYWLSGSLFWPLWLKLSGMKIGPKTEISTIMETIPELVEVEGYCFFADGIYLGASEIKNGNILFKNTKLGKEVFIGNHAIIEAGLQIPGNCLIGVSTIAEQKYLKEGSSWFGLPSFELPKREIIHYDERFTFNPTFVQFINRLFWEGSRFLFPVVPTIVGLYWIYYLFQLESSLGKYYFFIIGVPGLTILYGLILSLITFINKWLLIGKMKKGEHPLWSCWCSRWDFVYVMWRIFARPFMRYLEDTKILQCWLRLMGVEIGKNVALFGEFSQVVDPDMLHFKDNSTVTCLFQAHSFEDRVLKLDNIYIEKGASVNFRSILFYGAKVSENTRVLSHSVVMKNESLNKSTIYAGSPIERIMELN
ncbi:MAG: hypothetical protein KDK36_05765, partial [Leptospiraceae bacterium]|nr:hypothetical protein [Leptospiraceae bacterium]